MKVVFPFTGGPKSLVSLISAIRKNDQPHLLYIPDLFPNNTQRQFACVKDLTENLKGDCGHFWERPQAQGPVIWHRYFYALPPQVREYIEAAPTESIRNNRRYDWLAKQCLQVARMTGAKQVMWNVPYVFTYNGNVPFVAVPQHRNAFDVVAEFIDETKDYHESTRDSDGMYFEWDFNPWEFISPCTLSDDKQFLYLRESTDPELEPCCGYCEPCHLWLKQYAIRYSTNVPISVARNVRPAKRRKIN